MSNPWKDISLSDYENHMALDSVQQLQAMNLMMKGQLNKYDIQSVMILGIAGGNGLEHVDVEKITKVYGVDINAEYLATFICCEISIRILFLCFLTGTKYSSNK